MKYLFSCSSDVKAWELQRIFEDRGLSLRSELCVPRLRHLARIACDSRAGNVSFIRASTIFLIFRISVQSYH